MAEVVTFSKKGEIGIISVDNPPVNVLSHQVRQGIKESLGRGNAEEGVRALVICCQGKTFIAGSDVREFGTVRQEPLLSELVQAIEDSEKPVIAAMHGNVLGGGLVLALGCHYRLAAEGTLLGLPEVNLGVLPGYSGTQRLPRLVGFEKALELIVNGTPLTAREALAAGLVDEILEGDLVEGALAFASWVVAQRRPLRKVSELPLIPPPAGIFEEYARGIARRKRGYLAPFHCIRAVQAAAELPFAEGVELEGKLSLELHASPQAKAQQHLFFAAREAAKVPRLPAQAVPREVKTVGVLGTGAMGEGIASCFADAGIPVVLLEPDPERLEGGMGRIRRDCRNHGLVTPAGSYHALGEVDLVIEAFYEEQGVMREVFARLGEVCKKAAILASNSSYLDIDEIAAASGRPGDVIGMHFFCPAQAMKALENVRGARTSPEVCATAMKVGRAIGKTPVLIGTSYGFVGNRMLANRSREAYFMLEEGATPQQIDKVLYDFGFPMGHFAMSDLTGLDVLWRSRQAKLDRLSPREKECDILDQLCRLGRHGQKSGAGFYRYHEGGEPRPDPAIEELIAAHSRRLGLVRRTISNREILERCLYSMINEGARILEEGVVCRSLDIDVIGVNAYGFPAYFGGPMYYADQIGLKTVYEAILEYRDLLGEEYWKPAPLLERLVREGKGFCSVNRC